MRQVSQEHQQYNDGFIKVRVYMAPKSLDLDVPLQWQVNKLKCLIVSVRQPKLLFEQFQLKHGNEILEGFRTFRQIIATYDYAWDQKTGYFALNLIRCMSNLSAYDDYFKYKLTPLAQALNSSHFQPLLHPNYYSLLKLTQTSTKQQVRPDAPIQQQQGQPPIGLGFGIGVEQQNNNQNRGFFERFGQYFIRAIQFVSAFTIFQFITHNSDSYNLIVIGLVIGIYIWVGWLKQGRQVQQRNPVQVQQQRQDGAFIGQRTAFIAQKMCLVLETLISFVMALFPNWTIQLHRNLFRGTFLAIQAKLKNWKNTQNMPMKADSMPSMPQDEPQQLYVSQQGQANQYEERQNHQE